MTRTAPGAGGKTLRWIIVNADDACLSASIDESIFDLIERGKLTSATILVRRHPALVEKFLRRARDERRAGFGLHLDLDHFFLFDETGHYGDDEADVAEGWEEMVGRRRAEIEREVRGQIRVLREADHEITHLDGHHCAHLLPPVLDLLLPILADEGIDRIRFRRSFYRDPARAAEVAALLVSRGIRFVDHFLDFAEVANHGLPPAALPGETIELMTHIDLPHEGAEEWRAWHYGALRAWRIPDNVELVSYGDL